MNAFADAPRRRGACPGLSAPMPTGDGLLARLSTGATIGLTAANALCAAARRHGNGIIEITARGSIQVRGLTPASAPAFADAAAALAIDGVDAEHCHRIGESRSRCGGQAADLDAAARRDLDDAVTVAARRRA